MNLQGVPVAITIKSVSGKELYVSDASSVRAALEEAATARANLREANLRGADLRGADLRGANLWGADLRGANLRGANLWGADLRGANLWEADLRGANLRGANLRGADLWGANLRGADLRGANLWEADLREAKNISAALDAQTNILPEGSLVGWKKARDSRIVKLKIPASAQRSNSTGRKCRADRAKILAIYNSSGEPVDEAFSTHDPGFKYAVGETIKPVQPFDTDRWNECASGIHFFITRQEAEDY